MNLLITTLTKKEYRELLTTAPVFYGYHTLPVGTLFICTVNNSIIEAAFCDPTDTATQQFILKKFPNAQPCDKNYLTQLLNQPTVTIITTGTEFQNNVWQAATQIPAGATSSYKKIAQQIGKPTAYRAVANALAQNRVAYFIPCHRVTLATGDLCGYRWGVAVKAALLKLEKAM